MKDNVTIRRSTLCVIMLTAVLGGCASMDQYSCDMHETRMRGVKPQTTYQVVEPKPGQSVPRALPSGSVAQATTYSMSFKPGFTKPCSTLMLNKDVVLLRSDDPDVVITEVREMYAEDGTLIIPASQDITEQVRKSGQYLATTPLPIPKTAPPGKYKVVSKLLFERRGDRRPPVQIARAEGFFYIIPPQ